MNKTMNTQKSAISRSLGLWGEQRAHEYLMKKGYATVFKGYRTRFGEIDLIMQNEKYLLFVEVKTRKNSDFAYAREYVGKAKQAKIIKAAKYWLMTRPTKLQPRFDVIEIYTPQNSKAAIPEITHIENAF